jgi:hypothetical protein
VTFGVNLVPTRRVGRDASLLPCCWEVDDGNGSKEDQHFSRVGHDGELIVAHPRLILVQRPCFTLSYSFAKVKR